MLSARKGVRLVACYEAISGLAVLLAGFGLLTLVHQNVQDAAEQLVSHLHLNPASRYPHIFIDLARATSDARLWSLAALAFCYAGFLALRLAF